jgi:AraC-like DNA-binding protein
MSRDEKIALKIALYVHNNLDKRLDISSLCRQFRLGKSTLERIFNEVYYQPVHHYILTERMKKSSLLIRGTDIPIKRIASLCGFSSTTTFTRKFRKYFGITPAALRKIEGNVDLFGSIG